MKRHLPGYLAALGVALLLGVFIAYPLGGVLVESVQVNKPMPGAEMRDMTLDALGKMQTGLREKAVTRWLASLKPRQKMEATAAALMLIGEPVNWDRKTSYDKQIAAARESVQALDSRARAAFEDQYPIAVIMLHKRIALAFKVKNQLSIEEFDRLRSGELRSLGLEQYLSVFRDPRLRKAGKNSLMLAFTASFLTTFLAFAIAYGINRGAIAWPGIVRYATLVPLVSPPVILATAAILLFGRNGAITNGLLDQTLGWIDADVHNLYGLSGVIVAQVLGFLPPAFIIMDNVLSKHDGRVEEAAASQGASPWQVFRHVTLPLAQPGLVRAFMLVFILSMTDFGNPLVIGKDLPVLAGILYDEMIGFHNTELAAALAVWLIVPAVSIYYLLERIGRRKRFVTAGDTGGAPELPVPAVARVALTATAWSVIFLIVLLYGSIVVGSFVRIWGVDYSFTLNWYTAADAVAGFDSEWQGVDAVWYSLKVVAIAAPLGGLLAAVVAYLVERVRPPGRSVLSFVSMAPAILPGVIFGVGYIVAFNLPLGVKGLALTGTMAILVLNILFANIFVGVLAGRAILQRLDVSVDEAAEVLGASLTQRFILVVLPMMRHAAILGTFYVFVHGMTTLSAVVFLVSPGNELVSVAIFDSALNGYYGAASAMSVTILVIVSAVMAGMWCFERYGPAWALIGAQAAGRA